jgi:hypothetical protein
MNTTFNVPVAGTLRNWRDLYKAAIFETDQTKKAFRITEAERALVRRERRLFLTSGNERELNALNTALHELEALRGCLELAA